MEIQIVSKEYIKPSSSTPSHLKTYAASLWDQFLAHIFFSSTLFYVNSTPQTSLLLKHSLSKTLSHFYPLAGKVKDRLSIDCNDQGAYYMTATCNVNLHELLIKPDLYAFSKFNPDVSVVNQNPAGSPVLMIQETTFPDGGLVIGISVSHLAVDATGLGSFIKNWATTASSPSKEVVSPYNDLPRVFPLYEPFPKEAYLVAPSIRFLKKRKIVLKRLVFNASSIDKLKLKVASSVKHPSSIEVVSAIITKSVNAALKAKSIVIWQATNLRKNVTPPIPNCSLGNLVWLIQAICSHAQSQDLSELVLKLRNSKMKLQSEFPKNAKEGGFLKMFEEVKRMKSELSDYDELEMMTFSSWCKLGIYETDFGFGKPIWNSTCPAFDSEETMFHNMCNLNDTRSTNGVEAMMMVYPEVAAVMEEDVELLKYASIDPSPLDCGRSRI